MNISLNGTWLLRFINPKDGKMCEIPAQVPGNVYGDIVRAGIEPDPYFGTNSDLFRKYEFNDWEYVTTFDAPVFKDGERVQLTFNGVDTVFECFINGKKAGEGRNMFIEHRFDITDLLEEKNELVVKITSSVNYARQFDCPAMISSLAYNYEGLYIRRAMHTYGWDIAPRLVGAGLWRSVTVDVLPTTRWKEVYLFTRSVHRDRAELGLHWQFETEKINLDGFGCKLTMKCGDSVFHYEFTPYFICGKHLFSIPAPKLWWPLGSGEQNLYDCTLTLFYKGKKTAVKTFRTGIRDVTLERSETNFNGEGKFCFLVNNKKIFIKGSNWVPANALHGECPERIAKDLELFKELGCNMIRSWGGSVYEDHEFFDICDKERFLVWQDFMLACETPPQDSNFKEARREEIASVIKKLRQHPSLAIWSGDNECDENFFHGLPIRWKTSMNSISRQLVPAVVFEHDPARDYLPSSPYLCDEIKEKNCRYASPEQHLWGPRDNWKNPFYLYNTAIFASEIGYHGMSSVESVKKFIPAESINARSVDDPNWANHAAQPFSLNNGSYSYRIGLMNDQVMNTWGFMPESLEEYASASQSVQAEAVKSFIEGFRIKKWEKTGLIWWNVIDCWPQFSDAVVDYYYDKKLAFYYIKNVQKPVMLMFDEPQAWNIRLHGVNDLDRPVEVNYKVTDFITGEVLMQDTVTIAADSAMEIKAMKVCQGKQQIFCIEFEYENCKEKNHYLMASAPISWELYSKFLKVKNYQ